VSAAAIALALVSALLFALGATLQSRAVVREPRTLFGVLRRRLWLSGLAADGAGVAAQAAALALGPLALVQPLSALTLVFALPLAAVIEHRRPARGQTFAALVVTAGLGAFVLVAAPAGGTGNISPAAWAVVLGACAAGAGLLTLAAWRRGPAARAVLLGSAAGVALALSAALIKATVARLDHGITAVIVDWHLWALVAVAIVAASLAQASMAADRLGPALAAQLAVDPIVAVLLGVLAFGDHLDGRLVGRLGSLAGLAGLAATMAGVGWLTAAEGRDQRRRISRNAAVPAPIMSARACSEAYHPPDTARNASAPSAEPATTITSAVRRGRDRRSPAIPFTSSAPVLPASTQETP
jgi:drug/metabolite transporter (DMT)-like permease